jgi:thiamine biosynthesis lipoprotein
MLRRRFLASNIAPLLDGEPEPIVEESALIRVSRRAMATRFEIALPLGTPDAVAAAEDALDLIDDLEDQLTVYRDHSEVVRLNESAFEKPIVVEEGLFGLLQRCAELTQATQGAFDVAAGALIKAWGFHRREGRVPPPRERAAAMQSTGTRHIIFDAENRSIRFRCRGLEINLGSIGKGYALDRAGDLLREKWKIHSAVLHAGGSSVLALGTPPGDRRGWRVALRHPSNENRTLGTVRLRNRALGTSAATYQHFEYNGTKYGHVLDPRTGWPAKDIASASTLANTAAEADAWATAFFVLGLPSAKKLAESRPEIAGVILPHDTGVEPEVFGLQRDDYDPPSFRETLTDLLTLPEI